MIGEQSPADLLRTRAFWVIFTSSVLTGVANSASTPILTAFARENLDGDTATAGILVAVSSVAAIIAMPLAGALADRRGYRVVLLWGAVIAAVGLAIAPALPVVWGAVTSRILFGAGNAAVLTLLMAWLIALSPAGQRGRALSVYGLSVWLALALGPQLATTIEGAVGTAGIFVVCAALSAATAALAIALPAPAAVVPVQTATGPISLPLGPARPLWRALGSVWVPGVVAAAAWCGEGVMIAFLISHLVTAGMAPGGFGGASTVYAVFAASVILARLALTNLPDRIGPRRAATAALCALAAGLTTLAFARDIGMASVGAALVGLGFSPLYPALTMLATRSLRGPRALGLGVFSSFTSLGYGAGALVGGLVIAATSSIAAFLVVAALQIVALIVLAVADDDAAPLIRGAVPEPRNPAS